MILIRNEKKTILVHRSITVQFLFNFFQRFNLINKILKKYHNRIDCSGFFI